jgi:hypothetical protein
MSPSAKDQVFISYSHEDTKWREDLEAVPLRGGWLRLLSRGFRPFRFLESSIIPATCPNPT